MLKILDFMLLSLYCLYIFWLSDQSSLPIPMLYPYQDKVFHFSAYFIMGILAWRSFGHLRNKAIITALLSVIFCSLYGISDEWHQSFVEGRVSDVADWVADTAGAGLAVFLSYKLGNFLAAWKRA